MGIFLLTVSCSLSILPKSKFDWLAVNPRSSFDTFSLPVELPFPRNPDFCGREDILEEIYQKLQPLGDKFERNVCVLSAMGGIGKTQIALEYAHRHGHLYKSVFWLGAQDMDAVESSGRLILESLVRHYAKKSPSPQDCYTDISHKLGMPGLVNPSGHLQLDPMQSAWRLVKQWLTEDGNAKWLLLVDNNDDLDAVDLGRLLPTCNQGHAIVTSRRPELGFHGHWIAVGVVEPGEGLSLLLKGMKIEDKKLSEDGEHLRMIT